MVPRPPEVIQWFGFSKPKCCAAHIWCWPTSVVMKVSRPRALVISYRRRIADCGLDDAAAIVVLGELQAVLRAPFVDLPPPRGLRRFVDLGPVPLPRLDQRRQ